MQNTNQIKASQLIYIFITISCVSKLLILPSILNFFAGNASFISILILFILDIIVLLCILITNSICPNTNLFDLLKSSIGKPLAIAICFLFALFFFSKSILPFAEQKNLVFSNFYEDLPPITIYIPLIVLLCYCVFKGIKTFARTATLFMFFTVFSLAIILMFSIRDVDFSNIFPFLPNGLMPVFHSLTKGICWFGDFCSTICFLGAITPLQTKKQQAVIQTQRKNYSFFNANSVINFSMPHLSKQRNINTMSFGTKSKSKYNFKFSLNIILIVAMFVAILTSFFYVITIGVFGDFATHQASNLLKIPTYSPMSNTIDDGRFIVILTLILNVPLILYSALMLICSSVLISHIFKTKNNTICIIIQAVALLLIAIIFFGDTQTIFNFFANNFFGYVVAFQYIIPLFLPILAKVCKHKEKQKLKLK